MQAVVADCRDAGPEILRQSAVGQERYLAAQHAIHAFAAKHHFNDVALAHQGLKLGVWNLGHARLLRRLLREPKKKQRKDHEWQSSPWPSWSLRAALIAVLGH